MFHWVSPEISDKPEEDTRGISDIPLADVIDTLAELIYILDIYKKIRYSSLD